MGRFAVASGTRVQKFWQKFATLNYGGNPAADLPKDNYTTGLRIVSGQTVTSGSAIPVIAGYGAWGPIGTVNLKGPGNRAPIALGADYLDFYMRVRKAPYASVATTDVVTASTTTTWNTPLEVPLTVTPMSTLGCLFTGDTTQTFTLRLNNDAAAQVFSTVNGATIQGSWDVYRETFEAPEPTAPGGWLNDISFYHELSYQNTTALKNGSTKIELPINTDYMRIFLFFYTGSRQDNTYAAADGLYTSIDVMVNNKIHVVETIFERKFKDEMAQRYGWASAPPVGVAVIDFMTQGESRRDVFPTDPPDCTDFALTIVSTSSSNNVDVITETVSDSPFATKFVAAAAAAQQATTTAAAA